MPRPLATATLAASLLAMMPAAASAVECDTMAGRLLVLQERTDAPGYDILVRPAGAACAWNPGPDDFVLDDPDDAYWPIALEAGYLILDAGTGPERGLAVFDLERGTQVLGVSYEDGEGLQFVDGGFAFLMGTGEEATPANCPEHDAIVGMGFTPALFEDVVFDYATGSLERSGETVCAPTQ